MTSNNGEEASGLGSEGPEGAAPPDAESGVDIAARQPRSRRVTEREARERGERSDGTESVAGGGAERGRGPVHPDDERFGRARELERAGSLLPAIELYRELIREDGANIRLRLALGAAYERRGEPALALEQYEATRELAPDSVDVLLGMASALTELKRYDQAEAALKRALRLEPSRADVHGSMGTLSYKRGLYGQAEQELKRALDLDPAHGVAYFYRGEALNQLGRVDEALEMLERSVQLHPHNPRAFFTMGILYDRKHLPQQAAAMYRKAREVTPA